MFELQLPHDPSRPVQDPLPVSLIAYAIENPENMGALFRLADAFGLEHIYFVGDCVCLPNRKVTRVARTTEKRVPYTFCDDALSVINEKKQQGATIVSLEIAVQSQDLRQLQVNTQKPICLVVGNERSGIPDNVLDASDAVVHIPMRGANSSMNVAAAAAVALYEITRRFP